MGRALKVQLDKIDYVKSRLGIKGYPSQRALAIELGLSRATVSNYLNGKPVDYLNFVEISEKLGLSWLEISLQDEPIKKDGILVKNKVFALNREIKVDFKDLFKALTKALVDLRLGNFQKIPGNLIDALYSVNLDLNSPTVAWLLIFRSLNRAIYNLVKDNKELFDCKYKSFGDIEDLIEFSIENNEVFIDRSFFTHPKDLSILKHIEKPFKQWLQLYGLDRSQAESTYNRLPGYFVFALNNEWREHQPEYYDLHKHLITPFSEVGNKEECWLRYSSWLQKQVDEPIFSEAFSLRQVYVQPRAYYKEEIRKNDDLGDRDNYRKRNEHEEYIKIVVELENYLNNWLEKADKDDAIRIISGDPGAGKSSFSKMFAANVDEKQAISVLFIPLHHFDPTGDLVESVGRFVRDDDYLYDNPLDGELKESRLLIVFDGLDELSMQGKLGAEVARSFINEVQKTVGRINYRQIHLQVIISGRPIVISANKDELRKHRQVLYMLPYFIPKIKRIQYQDENNLLAEDRRNLWWQKYGQWTGKNYKRMPKELKLDNLQEITTQPLLNYLIALSYERSQNPDIESNNKIVFSEETNLNAIYEDLLKAVYNRNWDTQKHPTLKGISYPEFVRILEEIALAAWHGNGRTTTIRQIQSHCESNGLIRLLERFTDGAKVGVTNLLTSFYFRQSGYSNNGDNTFEFTHKSFGEYLTAKRIVRELANISEELKRREEEYDKGWDEKQALTKWIQVCGMTAIDEYLFNFVCHEISLHKKKYVKEWQKTLCHLIPFMLCQGMPMEQINPRPSYKEELHRSKNTETALLIVLNACARYTLELSKLDKQIDNFDFLFKSWIARILAEQKISGNTLILDCLTFMDFQKYDFSEIDLSWTNFKHSDLRKANFRGAYIRGMLIGDARIDQADFRDTSISVRGDIEADLYRNELCKHIIDYDKIQTIKFKSKNLSDLIFDNADFVYSSFEWANFSDANFYGADFTGANFEKATFDPEFIEYIKFLDEEN